MLTTAKSRPERFLLSTPFCIILGLCGALVYALSGGGIADNISVVLSLILSAVAAVQVRSRAMFKGSGYPLFPTFLLLQAAAPGSLEGTGFALFAFSTVIVYLFCFSQPEFTRTFFLIFLFTGVGAVYSPQWLLWAGVSLVIMIAMRAFSMRGFVAAILGLLTPFILIPTITVASTQSLEPLLALVQNYRQPLFAFPVPLTDNYIFSASLCAILAMATFLTAYGYPARMRAQNMAVFVVTVFAIAVPTFTIDCEALWLPIINLCGAYHATHFIAANKRAGWVLALIIWTVIIGFIAKELCGF